MTFTWQRSFHLPMLHCMQRTSRRHSISAFIAMMTAGTLLGFSALPARAQFNGPPSGVETLEMNRPAIITTDPAILYPPISISTLLPGDSLTVRIYGDADYTVAARIDRDGGSELPLMGRIHLAGLTVGQADALIAEKLVALGMYRDPQVVSQVEDGPGQLITIFGETRTTLPAKGATHHLLEILASGGGITPTISHIVTINRPGLADPIVIDIGTDPMNSAHANIPIFAGDMIITSRIGQVYVMGDFKSPGIVTLNTYTPLTLLELSTLSGGPLWAGKKDQLHIIRTIGNRRVVSIFDLKKVLNGTAPDPILQPNDIVYLPNSALKAFFANGTLSQIVSYLSLGIGLVALR